ncbi:MAG: hypothetical protein AAB531_01120 [Patescibacteria group bacterium]
MKEIDEIIEGLEAQLETKPRLAGVIQVLTEANNLNDTVGGPKSILPEQTESEFFKRSQIWNKKLIDFFSEHVPLGSFSRIDRLQVAQSFNEYFAEDLTDDTKLIMLLIPSSEEEWISDQNSSLRSSREIDQSFKSSFNRMIFTLRNGAKGRDRRVNDDLATIGWFRNSTNEEVVRASSAFNTNGIGKATLTFMRIALARSAPQEVPIQ